MFNSIHRYRLLYHLGFWAAFIGLFTFLLGRKYGYLESLKDVSLEALVYAVVVYINLFILIPKTLAKRKHKLYFALLGLCIILMVPIHASIEYFNFHNIDEFKNHIDWKNLTLFSFINLSFMIAMTTGLHLGVDWYKQQQEKQELESEKLHSELRFLKSQINPHFLFNSLNNLYALTLKKSDRAPEMVLKISEIMRYMLYDSNVPLVPLEKELNYINNYIELQKLRQGSKTHINIEIEGQANGHLVAPLLFSPFLENSFKHGIDNNIDQSWVNIVLQINQTDIDFKIANGKFSIPQAKNKDGGIGLKNVKRRLELLYPGKYTLTIDDNNNTYSTTLKLNLK